MKTTRRKGETDKEEIARLKEEYIAFYKELPMQKYAAKAIMRSVDTVQLWAREDPDFSAKVELAKAEYVRSTVKRTKPEFRLERLHDIRDDFKPPANEHTGDLNFNITRGKPVESEGKKTG